MMGQMKMDTPGISNYYLCDFLEIIDKKLEKNNITDDDMYILHIKKYASIKNCSDLER
jgi:hypothetical protein